MVMLPATSKWRARAEKLARRLRQDARIFDYYATLCLRKAPPAHEEAEINLKIAHAIRAVMREYEESKR